MKPGTKGLLLSVYLTAPQLATLVADIGHMPLRKALYSYLPGAVPVILINFACGAFVYWVISKVFCRCMDRCWIVCAAAACFAFSVLHSGAMLGITLFHLMTTTG